MYNQIFGKKGEQLAVEYLLSHGFKIIQQNWTCHWGEIDIISQKKSKIHFVEVKTRKENVLESFTWVKQKHLVRSVEFYLHRYFGSQEIEFQIDFIGIEQSDIRPKLIYIEHAVEL